jgi:hypothetical protein
LNTLDWQSSFILSNNLASKSGKFWKEKDLLIQGAIFLAIIAASIHMVQDQQNGSNKSCLNFRQLSNINHAATFSLIGASAV